MRDNSTPHPGPDAVAQEGALARAAAAGDAALVEALLAGGARADEPPANGETALMRAVSFGYEDVTRILLLAGVDVNARRADGFTPLILAAFFGHAAVVRLLVEHGADLSARTRLGTSALDWARARGFGEITSLIEGYGDVATRGEGARAAGRPYPVLRRPRPALPSPGGHRDGYSDCAASAGRDDLGSEVRALASEVTLVFGERSGASGGSGRQGGAPPGDDAAQWPARATANGAAFSEEAAEDDRSTEDELFTAFRPAPRSHSWKGAAGLFLLALVCAASVYAAWVSTRQRAARVVSPQALDTQPVEPLTAAPPDAQSPQPSPDASPDAQSPTTPSQQMPAVTSPVGQPVYVYPPGTNPAAGTSPAPAVVSEAGQTPVATPAPRRRSENTTRPNNSAGVPADAVETDWPRPRRDESRTDVSREGGRQPAAGARSTRTDPPRETSPAASPRPTPKVIQWPPN